VQETPWPRVYRFGVFEADVASGELRKQGLKIKIQGQPFQILCMLLEKPGEVVTRDEIRRVLWAPDTFVDFEQGLGTAIKKLRQALGDDADTPRYIETLPKRGYRFIASVERSGGATTPAPDAAIPVPDAAIPAEVAPAAVEKRVRRMRGNPVAITLAGILAAGIGMWWVTAWYVRRATPAEALPLTTYPGVELSPTFSPNGGMVAFSWDGEKRNNVDIYVKPVGSGPALRLTTDPAADINPAWSPDGRSIVFHRLLPDNRAALIQIPSLGGPERLIANISIAPSSPFGPFSSWSPDSNWLAISDRIGDAKGDASAYAVFFVSSDTGERRQLTHPPPGLIGDSAPAFSPNGESLVFIRSIGHGVSDLYVVQISPQLIAKGEPRRLTFDGQSLVRPGWTEDNSSIIYALERSVGSLWRIPASGGRPEPLGFGYEGGQTPAASLHGHQLAYARRVFDTNIWQAEIQRPLARPSMSTAIIESTRLEWDARFSPDGRRIAFASDRSGESEIWICDSTGANAAQLTRLHGSGLGSPRWSPDGSTLVFDSATAGQWDIYTVALSGRKLRRMTSEPSNEHVPSWSRDGKFIYFASNRTGEFQVWKTPAEGGRPVQVTRNGGYGAFEAPDGQTIYYSKQTGGEHTAIWETPSSGGPETMVVEFIKMRNFDVARHGIYFVPDAAQPPYVLRFLDFTTGSVHDVLRLHQQLYSTLSVSPDERWLLYSTIDQEGSDLILVENFR
jgi:Tol biopolymer transport system component/DNA-binding winged helix-turn-helix (wHTH) protein